MSAHYVYRCYDAAGRLVYVGFSRKPFERLMVQKMTAWWADEVSRTRISVFGSEIEARSAEKQAILTENPRFNMSGRWAARHTFTLESWRDFLTALERTPHAHTTPRKNRIRLTKIRIAKLERQAA